MPLAYKTVIGQADTIDADVNHLAKEGWMVQQAFVVGSIELETEDADMEMPILAYLMFKNSDEVQGERPQRRVLGGKIL